MFVTVWEKITLCQFPFFASLLKFALKTGNCGSWIWYKQRSQQRTLCVIFLELRESGDVELSVLPWLVRSSCCPLPGAPAAERSGVAACSSQRLSCFWFMDPGGYPLGNPIDPFIQLSSTNECSALT